jgi:hypothetical protein
MNAQKKDQQNNNDGAGFASFISKRIVLSIVVIIAAIWILNIALGRLNLADRHREPGHENSRPGSQVITHSEPRSHPMAAFDSHHEADPIVPAQKRLQNNGDDALQLAKPKTGTGDASTSETTSDHPEKPMTSARHQTGEQLQTADIHASNGNLPKNLPDNSPDKGKAAIDTTTQQAKEQTVHTKTAALAPGNKKAVSKQPEHTGKTSDANHAMDRSEHQTETDKSDTPVDDITPKEQVHTSPSSHDQDPVGVAFVDAVIQPIDFELNHRFWGWRPNDIINVTDNINNFQLGVLEVTRRTVVQLAQRISRTGSTDSFNPHLENAMNWLMVKADRYWFPAPESKYKESLSELNDYKEMLISGKASFYIRTDNLIPLLIAFEDLLGSCDENLVKSQEDDGKKVSLFKTDDYFYYAKGVASTMAVILEAVHHDFSPTLESRNGSELLHHAILSCKIADKLNPLIIMNSDLDGIFANHRANMAAPISHAKFYIGQLIKTLST